MTIYSYDPARMMAVVEDFGGTTQRIRTMLTELDANARSSMGEWTSEAKQSYELCKARWDAAAARMPHLLQQATNLVPQVLDNLQRGDKQGVDLWQGTSAGRR